MTTLTDLPAWAAPWQSGDKAVLSMGIEWMRTRPASIRALLLRFPPSCIVRLQPPCPFAVGIVSSLFEDGQLGVRPRPGSLREEWHRVSPEEVEVIGYCAGLTPTKVRRLLDMAGPSSA